MENNSINWTIIEPNPIPVPGAKARFIKGYFNSNFKADRDYDTIIHSHVFEHRKIKTYPIKFTFIFFATDGYF